MTDKQRAALVRSLTADLKKTAKGYKTHPDGPNWQNAMRKIDRLLADLTPRPIPSFGPVVENGLAMGLFAPTHNTDGVKRRTGSEYPAFDTEFGQIGRWVIAPEGITVTDDSSAQGGDAFYAVGASGLKYWVGHIAPAPRPGTKFRRGQRIARIANQARPHLHWGVDARPLIGRDLRWGANGNGPDYTFGSPTINAQLRSGQA